MNVPEDFTLKFRLPLPDDNGNDHQVNSLIFRPQYLVMYVRRSSAEPDEINVSVSQHGVKVKKDGTASQVSISPYVIDRNRPYIAAAIELGHELYARAVAGIEAS